MKFDKDQSVELVEDIWQNSRFNPIRTINAS